MSMLGRAAVAALAFACLPSAHAASVRQSDVARAVIKTDDLNLYSTAGRDHLNRRINGAIRTACHAGSGLSDQMWSYRCRRDMEQDAAEQISLLLRRDRQIALAAPATITLR
jgi:UrcA family protein